MSTICDIQILSVGKGDLTIKFDGSNEPERRRAEALVTDLLRQGYALMVEVGRNEKGPIYQRVEHFDPATNEYVVFGDAVKESDPVHGAFEPTKESASVIKKEKPVRIERIRERVPSSNKVVAVSRSAGGFDPQIVSKIRKDLSLKDVGRIL